MGDRANSRDRADPEPMIDGLVSVILPTYNRATEVVRAIDSVLAQTYDQLELIVVDDCSTDETGRVLEEASRRDARIRPISLPSNLGLARVRNPGLEAARGEFLAFIDSDDQWLPWKVEAQIEVFRRFPDVGLCWTDMVAVDDHGRRVHDRYLRKMYSMYRELDESEVFEGEASLELPGCDGRTATVRHGDIYRWMFRGNIVHTPTIMVRRGHMKPGQRFDHPFKVGEDWPFHLDTVRRTRAALLDEPAILYRVGASDQATSGAHSEEYARAYVACLQREIDRYGDELGVDRSVVDRAFANGHAWLAGELVDKSPGEARRHLIASLRRRPGVDRRLAQLIRTMLPRRLGDALRRRRRES